MFRYFENLVNPYPEGEPRVPPRGLLPFIVHFSRPVAGLLVAMSLATALVSATEVVFFHYMGELVDWLSGAEREAFSPSMAGVLPAWGCWSSWGCPCWCCCSRC